MAHLLETARQSVLEEAADELALRSHSWPGNVRELEAEAQVRRLALTCDREVGPTEVRRALGMNGPSSAFPQWIFEGKSYRQLMSELRREHLLYLFDRFDGNVARIARELGTTKRNVYTRLSRADLRPVDLRARGSRAG
jgi:DNA-binding NtrC family response regulator